MAVKINNELFKQHFENKVNNYQMLNGRLVHTDSDDAQALMNSREQDTLTDMFNKYMNGEANPGDLSDLTRPVIYDATTRDLDAVQAAEQQQLVQQNINQLLIKKSEQEKEFKHTFAKAGEVNKDMTIKKTGDSDNVQKESK